MSESRVLSRSLRRVALTVAVGVTASAAPGQRSPPPSAARDQWSQVRDTIRATMEQRNVASVAVAVARGGQIVWEEAFGWADREKMIRATPNTMYSLASISKPFTATAVMMLVEQRKIDLDKPANDYLGSAKLTGLAGDASGATVRRVLSHTAGLPVHHQFFFADQPYAVPPMEETIRRYGILVTPPGEVYQYSNLGYGILDEIVARTSGMSYAEFMRARVFAPLGLTRTTVGLPTASDSLIAQRYDRQQRSLPFYDFDHRGASAIYSSAHDLVRFGMFHLKPRTAEQQRILTDASVDAMVRAVPPAAYGLGWFLTEEEGLLTISHTGLMPGVETALFLYPAEDVVIVVLMNGFGGGARILREIERVAAPRYAAAHRPPTPQQQAAMRPSPLTAVPELLGDWVGMVRTWNGTIPIKLAVAAGGEVRAQLGSAPDTVLRNARWQNDALNGVFDGTITTSDASRSPHNVILNLRLSGGKLIGSATAASTNVPQYFVLSSFATLERRP